MSLPEEKKPHKFFCRNRAVVVMVIFFVVFSGLIAAYVRQFERQLISENKLHLSEVSGFVAAHMTTVVTGTQDVLKAVAAAIPSFGSDRDRMKYLQEMAQLYSFAYMGYAGADGLLHATVPSESVDVSAEAYFREALAGKAVVSDNVRKIFTNRAVSGILIAVPMPPLAAEAQPGILVAMLGTRSLSESLNLESFGGEGYCFIIDRRGSVIKRTNSLDFGNLFQVWKGVRFHNGYSLERFRKDVAAGREGLTSFVNPAGAMQYAYYRALPFNGWILINVVSEQAVSGKTLMLTRELALLGGATALLFMGLVYWTMHSFRLSRESRLAAEAKSAFLANMSHEIRTPMNAIVGLSEILLRDAATPKQRERLEGILNSGKGLLTVINDILDLSRIESGKFSIIETPYELESLLNDLTTIAVLRIGEKPLEFLVDPDPGLPRRLLGDMNRVKQVLLNIVGNAIKFTEQGSIRLLLRAEEDEAGWLLHAEVRDTGIGIRKEHLDRLFVSFNRVDTRRNRDIEGTGLGLAISQRLCGMMGGNIDVRSEYGKGSSFFITLRQGRVDDTLLLAPVSGEVSLLVCEESAALREFESQCLDRFKVRHVVCATPQAFETRLREGGFTHVLASRETLARLGDGTAEDVRKIGLIPLRDHAFRDAGEKNVYLPLFALHLPRILSGKREDSAQLPPPGGTRTFEPLPHVSVLIVDDNELNILVAQELMAPYGMRVGRARSGREAIQEVLTRNYDLVLMDHMMPEMDGVEATRLLRELANGKYRDLPIVALTANTTAEARRMFLDNGFNEFLAKPIEMDKLHRVLQVWLRDLNEQRATGKQE